MGDSDQGSEPERQRYDGKNSGGSKDGKVARPLHTYYDHIYPNHPPAGQSKGKGKAVERIATPKLREEETNYYEHAHEHDNNARRSPKGKGKEEVADWSTAVGPHAHYLPGCSGGKQKEKQVVSNAMMQAYVKMRGPCMGGAEDPLFEWIRLREDLPVRNPAPGHKKDVSRMLDLIDKSLEETNMGGDSPRDAVFEVERPHVDHIRVPEGMDTSIHALTASCAEFEFEDDEDEDDEEADATGGRVSPCTFLAWSKGCTRWDDSAAKVPHDSIAATHQRQRPSTPTPSTAAATATPPRDRYPHWYNEFEDQYDAIDGEPLTPRYHVPTEPSIVYTPPGVDPLDLQEPEFQAQYTRMAPLAAWDMRRHRFGGPATDQDVEPSGQDERFTWDEIEAAAQQPQAFGHLGTFRGADLRSYLSLQWRAAATNEAAEAAAHAEASEQEARIAALERDAAALRGVYLPALRRRRAWRARRGRIADLLARHHTEAQARLNASFHRLCRQRARRDRAAARLDALELEVAALCLAEGLECPQDVYDEVDGTGTGTGNAQVEEAPGAWRGRGPLRIEVPPTEV
ncbi:hypothetical protein F4775DRAFT_604807 [Biscogniauxia sp. FL1348]|nr:hypothetical protein F4775DRAFT_604807 [Biscogniauxia sp. FL1348]